MSAPIPPRLPLIDVPEDAATRELFERLAPGRGILNLHRMMAHAPALMKASNATALALRRETALSRALAELVVMRIAQLMDCGYVWSRHVPLAREAGVSDAMMAAVAHWPDSAVFTSAQKAALGFAEKAAIGAAIPDDVFAALRRELSPREIVELTQLIGFYVSSALFIKALAIPDEKA